MGILQDWGGKISGAYKKVVPTKQARNIVGGLATAGLGAYLLPGVIGSGGLAGKAAGAIKGAMTGVGGGGGIAGLAKQAAGQVAKSSLAKDLALSAGTGLVSNLIYPQKQLPQAPTVNPELGGIYQSELQRYQDVSGMTPTGYSDEALAGLRSTMETDRARRLEEARRRTSERAIDLGRASSSTTDREIREVERAYAQEAEAADAQMLAAQEAALRQDRSYLDQLRSQVASGVAGLTGQAYNADLNRYNRDLLQAQAEQERANQYRTNLQNMLASYLGKPTTSALPQSNVEIPPSSSYILPDTKMRLRG